MKKRAAKRESTNYCVANFRTDNTLKNKD
jgi:hypothetical protein